MELIDNVSKTLKQDFQAEIQPGSRITIAASCFSIYAFQELKEHLLHLGRQRGPWQDVLFHSDLSRKSGLSGDIDLEVIKAGVKTKVLMLSATPVNNRFNDLKNQLQLAYEGESSRLDALLSTTK